MKKNNNINVIPKKMLKINYSLTLNWIILVKSIDVNKISVMKKIMKWEYNHLCKDITENVLEYKKIHKKKMFCLFVQKVV